LRYRRSCQNADVAGCTIGGMDIGFALIIVRGVSCVLSKPTCIVGKPCSSGIEALNPTLASHETAVCCLIAPHPRTA
jgi:hypothetical protein